MFHPVYTLQNNQQVANLMQDPLKLQRAMRLYPHDDNQGGFFVAVFEKFADTPNGYIMDSNYEANPWLNPHVRQKNLLDQIEDFAKWFEEQQLKEWERDKVPESEREHLGLMQ